MYATVTPAHCHDVLGFDAPECDECEASGTLTYFRGPNEEHRECEMCIGVGRRLDCPYCTDGTTPITGGTCHICDGYAALY